MCQEGQPGSFRARLGAERITGLEQLTVSCQRFPLFYNSKALLLTVAAPNQLFYIFCNQEWGRGGLLFPTPKTSGGSVATEEGAANTDRQPAGAQLAQNCTLKRLKSSGEAAAVDLKTVLGKYERRSLGWLLK